MRHAVLLVDHSPAIGGAENSLLLLLARLDREQWDPHLVTQDGLLADRAESLKIPVHRIRMPRLRRSLRFGPDWMKTAFRIAEVGRSVHASLLHANTVRAAMYTAPAAQMVRRPFLWHMRDFWLSENRPRRLWTDRAGKRTLCRAAHGVIANSQAVADQLPCLSKTVVVHNGIDTTFFNPDLSGDSFRRRFMIPAGAPLVGMVGRLRPWKGQTRFLRMAAALSERHPDAHFVVVGGDPFALKDGYAAELQRQCHRLGLQNRLTFTGHVDDTRPALAAMDVFVHPGAPEPFGLVNLEAMAMAKPVVAFAHGALPEIVVEGKTGLLVPPDDPAALAEGCALLLGEPALARELGAAGHQRVVDCFDISTTVQKIQDIYLSHL